MRNKSLAGNWALRQQFGTRDAMGRLTTWGTRELDNDDAWTAYFGLPRQESPMERAAERA